MKTFPLRIWSCLCLGLVWTALAGSAAAAPPRLHKHKLPPDLAAILSQMNETGKHLKTVAANLEYTKVTVLVNDKSTESGQLFFRKGKNSAILINILKPEPKAFLVKKNRAEYFLPKINQIQVFNLEQKSELMQQFFLLGFGSDTGDLKKSYDLKYLSEEELDGDTTAVLELTPRRETIAAQLEKVQLWISEESWLPVQQKFFQPGGDYLICRYTAVKVNREIPASSFEIKAPSDAKYVKMN